jgi:hypothetical protein
MRYLSIRSALATVMHGSGFNTRAIRVVIRLTRSLPGALPDTSSDPVALQQSRRGARETPIFHYLDDLHRMADRC